MTQIDAISIHAPLAGSDHVASVEASVFKYFNPRSPCGERLPPQDSGTPYNLISIHAPLAGSDQSPVSLAQQSLISIHAPLAGSDVLVKFVQIQISISIHAPLAGSDHFAQLHYGRYENFNPRSPCGERQPLTFPIMAFPLFQSTLPLRGATVYGRYGGHTFRDFNPRSPCGERQMREKKAALTLNFNPRSPCGERQTTDKELFGGSEFQSTLPLRGATAKPLRRRLPFLISIHAPLAGSDPGEQEE